jgi:hypothetical protein
MRIFDFILQKPKSLTKETVKLFDKEVPLRIIKGKIIGFDIKTWTRHYDKDGNILRYGDGVDDRIVRDEKYKELELYLKTIHYDGYMRLGHHGPKTTLYFERDTLFEHIQIGDTITYFGLFLKEGSIWTNYFIYNHNNGHKLNLTFLDTISKELFRSTYSKTDIEQELERGIESIKIK